MFFGTKKQKYIFLKNTRSVKYGTNTTALLQIFLTNTHKLKHFLLIGGKHVYPLLLLCPPPCVSSLHGKSSSTGNLLEREDVALPVPDYGVQARMAAQSAAALHGRQQRPYSVAVPGFSQVGGLQNKHTQTHTLTSTHTCDT